MNKLRLLIVVLTYMMTSLCNVNGKTVILIPQLAKVDIAILGGAYLLKKQSAEPLKTEVHAQGTVPQTAFKGATELVIIQHGNAAAANTMGEKIERQSEFSEIAAAAKVLEQDLGAAIRNNVLKNDDLKTITLYICEGGKLISGNKITHKIDKIDELTQETINKQVTTSLLKKSIVPIKGGEVVGSAISTSWKDEIAKAIKGSGVKDCTLRYTSYLSIPAKNEDESFILNSSASEDIFNLLENDLSIPQLNNALYEYVDKLPIKLRKTPNGGVDYSATITKIINDQNTDTGIRQMITQLLQNSRISQLNKAITDDPSIVKKMLYRIAKDEIATIPPMLKIVSYEKFMSAFIQNLKLKKALVSSPDNKWTTEKMKFKRTKHAHHMKTKHEII